MLNFGKSEPVQVKSDELLSEDILILYLKNKMQKLRKDFPEIALGDGPKNLRIKVNK